MKKDYFEFSDQLYEDWYNQKLNVEESLTKIFQMDYAPEPYIKYDKCCKNPLFVLLTNPGEGMDFQNHCDVTEKKITKYENFLNISCEKYCSPKFKKGQAGSRIIKMKEFAHKLGYDGLISVETIPFHSKKLDKNKAQLVSLKSEILMHYHNQLKSFLFDKPVLIVSACRSDKSISNDNLENEWVKLQLELANINIENFKMETLVNKGDKITCAMFYDRKKYLVLMMGSNNLPNMSNLEKQKFYKLISQKLY